VGGTVRAPACDRPRRPPGGRPHAPPAIIAGTVSNWFRTYGFAPVSDDLLIGAYPLDSDDVEMLAFNGVRRVLNLVQDGEYRRGERGEVQRALAANQIEERRLRLVDYGGLDPDAIERAVDEVNGWLDDGERTYVHCRAGWQRSAAIAAGVVALREGIEIDEALARVQSRKPSADPLPHQREDLRRWWSERATRPPAT
jgi:protein-tyrosine phosphatase